MKFWPCHSQLKTMQLQLVVWFREDRNYTSKRSKLWILSEKVCSDKNGTT